MSILEMSLLGSALILVTVLARAAGQKRLPRQTFIALWYLAAARLLLPWDIPSAFSLYSLLESKSPAGSSVSGPAPVQAWSPSDTQTHAPQAAAVSQQFWTMIWLAGALAAAAVFLILYLRCLRRFAASLPVEDPAVRAWLEAHPLRRRLTVRQSDCISAPLTYGAARPVILLPKSILSFCGVDLDYILTHEYIHVLRFDALAKLILAATVCLHWFNPLVWLMYGMANLDMELCCDETVIRRCGRPGDYARLLIRMEEQRGAPALLYSNCSRNTLETRIKHIMKIHRPTVAALILGAVLVIGISSALATSPLHTSAQTTAPSADVSGDEVRSLDESSETLGQNDLPEVEWWTAEEYADWLENEKAALQELLGSSAWTNTDGDFVWTQEKIDATIALYENVLEQIRSGARISRSVNGSDDVLLMESTEEPTETADVSSDELAESALSAYAAFGLEYEHRSDGLYMFWMGKPVHSIFDAHSAIWIANNMRGLDLGPEAIELEAVYADGKLVGLQETGDAAEVVEGIAYASEARLADAE